VLILALDTSSPSGSLAVLRDERLIGCVSTSSEETYSSRIFRHLEFLLHELSMGLDTFDMFSVATGPGSFTGLRVGLAAAKAWAEVHQKPIAGVSCLEAVAAQSHSGASLLIPVLDARRGQIYAGFYRRADSCSGCRLAIEDEERVMTPKEFVEMLESRNVASDLAIVTPLPALISDELSRLETTADAPRRIQIEEVSPILAPAVGRLGHLRAQRGGLTDSLSLDANYVRRSDAELQWKVQPER
jgi:tRNA threonylcarbamoyladenosine biosynthesis protein TsaB